MHPHLSALPPRLCACGADTGSPALDECGVCEAMRNEPSSPAEDDDMQPVETWCRSCFEVAALNADWGEGYCYNCARSFGLEDDRTRRAIRDMHQLALDAHAEAVRGHLEGGVQ